MSPLCTGRKVRAENTRIGERRACPLYAQACSAHALECVCALALARVRARARATTDPIRVLTACTSPRGARINPRGTRRRSAGVRIRGWARLGRCGGTTPTRTPTRDFAAYHSRSGTVSRCARTTAGCISSGAARRGVGRARRSGKGWTMGARVSGSSCRR